jgi:hypothetical protein
MPPGAGPASATMARMRPPAGEDPAAYRTDLNMRRPPEMGGSMFQPMFPGQGGKPVPQQGGLGPQIGQFMQGQMRPPAVDPMAYRTDANMRRPPDGGLGGLKMGAAPVGGLGMQPVQGMMRPPAPVDPAAYRTDSDMRRPPQGGLGMLGRAAPVAPAAYRTDTQMRRPPQWGMGMMGRAAGQFAQK